MVGGVQNSTVSSGQPVNPALQTAPVQQQPVTSPLAPQTSTPDTSATISFLQAAIKASEGRRLYGSDIIQIAQQAGGQEMTPQQAAALAEETSQLVDETKIPNRGFFAKVGDFFANMFGFIAKNSGNPEYTAGVSKEDWEALLAKVQTQGIPATSQSPSPTPATTPAAPTTSPT